MIGRKISCHHKFGCHILDIAKETWKNKRINSREKRKRKKKKEKNKRKKNKKKEKQKEKKKKKKEDLRVTRRII